MSTFLSDLDEDFDLDMKTCEFRLDMNFDESLEEALFEEQQKRQELEKLSEDLQKELRTYKLKYSHSVRELALLFDKNKDLQELLETVQSESQTLYNSAQQEIHEQEIKTLQETLAKKQQEIECLSTTHQRDIEFIQSERSNLEQVTKDQLTQLDSFRSRISELEQSLLSLSSNNEHENSAADSQQIHQLQKNLEIAEEELLASLEVIESCQVQVSGLQQSLEEVTENYRLSQQTLTLLSEQHQKDNSSNSQLISQLQSEHELANEKIASFQTELSQLESQRMSESAHFQQEIQSLRETLQSEHQNALAKQKLDLETKFQEQILAESRKLSQIVVERDQLASSLEKSQEQIQQLEQTLERTQRNSEQNDSLSSELQSLNFELDSRNQTISSLNEQIVSHMETLRSKDETIRTLEHERVSQDEMIRSCKDDLRLRNESLLSLEEEISSRDEEIHNLVEERTSQSDLVRDLRAEIASRDHQIREMVENTIPDEQARSAALKQELDLKNQMVFKLKQDLERSKESTLAVEQNWKDVCSKLESSVSETRVAEQQHVLQVDGFREQIRVLEKQLHQKGDRHDFELATFERTIREREETNLVLTDRISLMESQISELQQAAQNSEVALQKKTSECSALQKEILRLGDLQKKLTESNELTKSELVSVQESHSLLCANRDSLRKKLESATGEVQRLLESQSQSFETEKKLSLALASLEELQEKLDHSANSLEDLKKQSRFDQEQLEKLSNQRIEQLQLELDQLRREHQSCSSSALELETLKNHSSEEISHHRAALEDALSQVAQKSLEISQLEHSRDRLQTTLSGVQSQLTELTLANDQLRSEVSRVKEANNNNDKENQKPSSVDSEEHAQLLDDLKEFQKQLESKDEELSDYVLRYDDLLNRNRALETNVRSLTMKLKQAAKLIQNGSKSKPVPPVATGSALPSSTPISTTINDENKPSENTFLSPLPAPKRGLPQRVLVPRDVETE